MKIQLSRRTASMVAACALAVTPVAMTGLLPAHAADGGGFEEGRKGWTGSVGPITDDPGRPAHGGSWTMWLGGNGRTTTEYEQQTVTVPPNGRLSYWIRVDKAETTTTRAYDTFSVTVDGTTVASTSNLDPAKGGYTKKTVDLSRWSCKTVTLRFSASEDSADQTSFVVDEVSLR